MCLNEVLSLLLCSNTCLVFVVHDEAFLALVNLPLLWHPLLQFIRQWFNVLNAVEFDSLILAYPPPSTVEPARVLGFPTLLNWPLRFFVGREKRP